MRKPKLSVCLLSFNTREVTLDCLKSISKHSPGNIEVLVLDNASSDKSYDEIAKLVKGNSLFRIFRGDKNLGFGGGNNFLVSKAKSDLVLFLNSDTIMIEDCFSPCIELLDENPDLIGVSCQLINHDQSVQTTGGYFPNLWRLIMWQLFIDDLPIISQTVKSIHPHQQGFSFLTKFFSGFGLYTEKGENKMSSIFFRDWLTGAFLMVRKELFQKVGGFDTKLFMYAEDLELCYRLKKLKGDIAVIPSTSIIHLGGTSSGSTMAISNEVKGIMYFFETHTSRLEVVLAKIIFFIGSLLRYLIFGIIRNNAQARHAYLTAIRNLA